MTVEPAMVPKSWPLLQMLSAECRFAESHYADCRWAECRGAKNLPSFVSKKILITFSM